MSRVKQFLARYDHIIAKSHVEKFLKELAEAYARRQGVSLMMDRTFNRSPYYPISGECVITSS